MIYHQLHKTHGYKTMTMIAFSLIRNSSWLGNEEETACQEVS